MFCSTKTTAVPSSILFEQGYPQRSQPLYPPNFFPHPSAQPPPPVDYPNPAQRHGHHHHHSSRPHLSRSDSDRIPRPNPSSRELKYVNLPRECLPRFIAIAKVNTMINRETCGLLLGKDKGHKFVVTTMLIPKQHSTSDTCTMDEEELVLRFTEERNLITLGWIHTHPTQTCFMSSVDLHTHSGFQRMLPESFAVVCAPRHNPSFGIFRLTDPPGLQTILTCTAKEAFHPHPDQPIYTDADKGHVQMKEGMSLEIVDLR
ncbi:Mov34-domain-containing protein [Armillaria gallica]|uniref:Mov34-domain-containing protein n=1 Tax=Armillaria gallica TaxID=47427 RepID=A0A2H3DAL2_ARMGA|nr:Mov34-domain-containing protein [Armillaria gallica]